MRLSNPSANATIVDDTGVATIEDDDGLPTVSINDAASLIESGVQTVFTVSLSNASSEIVTVDFATGNLSAITGSDYTENSGTLTFAPGVTRQSIGVGTIEDDDGLPTVSVNRPASVREADGLVTFTVSLSKASSEVVTVAFATGNISATSGSDYTGKSGTLTFDPGVTQKSIAVTILNDSIGEPKEIFNVTLSHLSANATILDGTGVATITDDDPTTVSINDAGLALESIIGLIPFTVTLSNARSGPVTVGFTTVNLTAIAGQDYAAISGRLTFAAGVTRRNISILILNDTMDEPNETFRVTLSAPSANATIADAFGVATIVDDDPKPSIRINNVNVSESGRNANLTVSLSNASSRAVEVGFATANGTATAAGGDYAPDTGGA